MTTAKEYERYPDIIAYTEECEDEKELEKAKKEIEKIKRDYDELPYRIKRIIRYKYMEKNTWETVAERMGRNATAHSLKMEVHRFFRRRASQKK